MLQMIEVPLPQTVITYLDSKQQKIDEQLTYAKKVEKGKGLWDRKSRPQFKQIRLKLDKMCVGQRRCNYCEDSAADEVEHIKPKDIYPALVFVWANYLYSCGPCNGPKSNQFAVFDDSGNLVEVSRGRNDEVVAPVEGDDAFINPRIEDPTDYITLDLETLRFIPKQGLLLKDKAKAKFTIKTLRLNSRDYLVKARESAYSSYRDSLELYVKKKHEGATLQELARRKKDLNDRHHATVWFEVKRQRNKNAQIAALFAAAPELL